MNRDGGGGLAVSVLAFYSDDPSLNPAGYVKIADSLLSEMTKMIIRVKGGGEERTTFKIPENIR